MTTARAAGLLLMMSATAAAGPWSARFDSSHYCALAGNASASDGERIGLAFEWRESSKLTFSVNGAPLNFGPVTISRQSSPETWTLDPLKSTKVISGEAAMLLLKDFQSAQPPRLAGHARNGGPSEFSFGDASADVAFAMFDACLAEMRQAPLKDSEWPGYGSFSVGADPGTCTLSRSRRDTGLFTEVVARADGGELRFTRLQSDHGPRPRHSFKVDATELFGGRGEDMNRVSFPLTLEQLDILETEWLEGGARGYAVGEPPDGIKAELGGPFARAPAAMLGACRDSLPILVRNPRPAAFELRLVSYDEEAGYTPVKFHALADPGGRKYMAPTVLLDAGVVKDTSVTRCLSADDESPVQGVRVSFREEAWGRVLAATRDNLDKKIGVFVDGELVLSATVRQAFTRALQVCGMRGTRAEARALARRIAGRQ